jgi:hypothetical protein
MVAIAAVGLLGGAAQVEAHGGGFHIGGAPHGGRPHVMAPSAVPLNPGAITPAAIQAGAFHAVAPPETERPRDDLVQHDFRQDRDFGQDRGLRHDRDRFGADVRIGFPGGAVNFAPRPPRRSIPVLYNYYYGAGDNYYSNAASDYGAPACPGWRWDASSQTRVWTDNCQG